MRAGRSWWLIAELMALAAFYHAPWYTHASAGFTMNAFDLAEWASVHPAVRSSQPPLLASFLLRMPLIVLGVGLAVVANEIHDARVRWIVRVLAALLMARLIPPVDFFTSARHDPNYRQMALLTLLAGVGWMVSLLVYRLSSRAQRGLLAALMLASALAGWWGMARTFTLLDNFAIDVQWGVGVIGYGAVTGIVLLNALWPLVSRRWSASMMRATVPAY